MPVYLQKVGWDSGPLGRPIKVEFKPKMPMWKFLVEVIVPATGIQVKNGTVNREILAGPIQFTFQNKHMRLEEVIADGGIITYSFNGIFSMGVLDGNACADGGDASGCPICLESSFNLSLGCFHRFHGRCIRGQTKCPMCMRDFTQDDRKVIDMTESLVVAQELMRTVMIPGPYSTRK